MKNRVSHVKKSKVGNLLFEIGPKGSYETKTLKIHVKEFKSEQFTFEIGPKGLKGPKVVPTGVLDFLSFKAIMGQFQK